MDSFPHHHQYQDRRILGPPTAGVGGDHHQWYPSSSPQPPPPPPASGYYNHHPPPQEQFYHYHHPYPPPPHHNQFPPPLPPLPISMSHHHPPPMLAPSAYPSPPLPNQAWGNPSWAERQGWEYPERNIPYNNQEDWAARAKAWASEKSGTENHHTQSHFTSISRVDENNHTYHDQYQSAGGPTRDCLQPSFPLSSNHQLPASTFDAPKQVNNLHGSASFSFGSSSYGTGYSSGVETIRTNADHMASPQKNYHPSLSIYEQEVSYNYSSAPGNRETVHQSEGLHVPLALPASVVPGQHSHSTLPVQMSSAKQPHFSYHGQPTNFLPDACDQPLDFQERHDSDRESRQKINYGLAGSAGAVGIADHGPAASTVPTWAPNASGVGFPQIPLGSAGTQFDPPFIPQASLPVQPSAFGGVPASNFQPIVPPVSVPYGVVPGASLHAAFNGDSNGALNLSERPKKAAVPNWLREEIIKKKSAIPNAVSTQPTGNSFDSFGSQDSDKSHRRADQGVDSKSIDSTRSTEDDGDDEEDGEAARSAAINQEIKRVLTEVLLKVTDELFDEIATKVLIEDEQCAAEESIIDGEQKVSPTANPPPKAAAKVLVPVRVETTRLDGVGENYRRSSPGGNILGLATYYSDNDDDDEIQSSKLSSGNQVSASHQHESNDKPAENDYAGVKNEADINGVAQRLGAGGSPSVDNLRYPGKDSVGVSVICVEPTSGNDRKGKKVPSDLVNFSQSSDTIGAKDDKGQESVSGHAKSDKSRAKDYQDMELKRVRSPNKNPQNRGDNKTSVEKTSRKSSDASDSIIHEDKLREKMEKREKFKERAHDKSSERGSKLKEPDSGRSSKDSIKDNRKETSKDKRDKYREDSERKREQAGDEKEDRTTRARKDPSRYNSRRSPSPSGRGKNSKDNSFSRSNVSGDEPSDNSKKRRKQSYNSMSPSPTKSRKRQFVSGGIIQGQEFIYLLCFYLPNRHDIVFISRQDSRSPRSKHAYHRHSPYFSSERRKRSRSISPVHQRSGAHKCS